MEIQTFKNTNLRQDTKQVLVLFMANIYHPSSTHTSDSTIPPSSCSSTLNKTLLSTVCYIHAYCYKATTWFLLLGYY